MVATTFARETPSCGMRSRSTVTVIDWPNSEGPARAGFSCLDVVQPVTAAAATSTAARSNCLVHIAFVVIVLLWVSEVAKRDPDRSAGADIVAGAVLTVKGHVGNRRNERGRGGQGARRCVADRGRPAERETGAERAH